MLVSPVSRAWPCCRLGHEAMPLHPTRPVHQPNPCPVHTRRSWIVVSMVVPNIRRCRSQGEVGSASTSSTGPSVPIDSMPDAGQEANRWRRSRWSWRRINIFDYWSICTIDSMADTGQELRCWSHGLPEIFKVVRQKVGDISIFNRSLCTNQFLGFQSNADQDTKMDCYPRRLFSIYRTLAKSDACSLYQPLQISNERSVDKSKNGMWWILSYRYTKHLMKCDSQD